jgi:myo-inositol-1(or 4)-monophosphatase
MEPKLSDIESWARQAGQILRSGYGQSFQIDHKGVIDLVTEMDRRSEAFLLQAIRGRFPDHRVISEEAGELSGDSAHVWHVDPLDGTVNYAHGVPIFSVSIAFAKDGEVRLGVVYDPMQDECFTAERGSGAYLNGMRLHVSSAPDLANSLLVTGFPYDIWSNPENNLDHYANFSLRSQGVRRLGSAALDLGYVAAGRLDGFWEISIRSYDIAAGALLVEEAGGIVTDIRGGPDYLKSPQTIIAANPQVHPEMLALLNE